MLLTDDQANKYEKKITLLTRDAPHPGSSVWVVALLVSDHSRTRCIALNPKSLGSVTHHILQIDRAIPGTKV